MEQYTIAITGGIGSGKSTVLDYLKTQGYPVFSCDEIYKEVAQSAEYLLKIKSLIFSASFIYIIKPLSRLKILAFKSNKFSNF